MKVWRKRGFLAAGAAFIFALREHSVIRVLDLGAGTGALNLEILNSYPNVSVACVDFSEAMITHAKEQLSKFGEKVSFFQRDPRNPNWTEGIESRFDAVVSSFLTHTLLERVEELYQEVYGLVNKSGCFLSCDFYVPPGSVTKRIYHRLQLGHFQARIKMQTGAEKSLQEVNEMLLQRREKYRAFVAKDSRVESLSKPTVIDHVGWLKEAGLPKWIV